MDLIQTLTEKYMKPELPEMNVGDISGIIEKVREREIPEYALQEEEPRAAGGKTADLLTHRRGRHAIDIPVGDDDNHRIPEEEYHDEKKGFFSVNSRVTKPDEFVRQNVGAAETAEPAAASS